MKLTYRGTSYEYQPIAIATEAGKIGGKYRGGDWRFRNLKKPPILMPSAELTYRGVKYIHGGGTTKAPALSVTSKARQLMAGQNQAFKKRQQSLLCRTAAELVFA